jgi:hypothetical protein
MPLRRRLMRKNPRMVALPVAMSLLALAPVAAQAAAPARDCAAMTAAAADLPGVVVTAAKLVPAGSAPVFRGGPRPRR